MDNTSNIGVYKFSCRNYIPVLPLVYSDALSYIETLGQFSDKLNEVIEAMNGLEELTLDEAKAYTDSKIKEQLKIIDKAVNDVNAIASELRSENKEFQDNVNARIGIVEYNFGELSKKTEADYKASINYTNLAIENNNDYLLANMQTELTKVKVLNYFTGAYVSIQEMFNYLAQFHLTNAITVQALVNRNKTVNQLIDYRMSMTELATNGGTIIKA